MAPREKEAKQTVDGHSAHDPVEDFSTRWAIHGRAGQFMP